MRQVFNGLPWVPPSEHQLICDLFTKYGRKQKIDRNSILKSGGDGSKLFYVVKGLCLYYVNYTQGKTSVMAILPPGRSICNLSCLSDKRVNVTTYAKKGTEVLSISPELYRRHIRENPEVADVVLKESIFKHESLLEGMIANATLSHEDRLRTFYKAVLHSNNLLADKGVVEVPFKLTSEELGMIINASRVTISRIQNKWIKNGLCHKEGSRLKFDQRLFQDLYDWHDHVQD